jgi:hypothetical protein
MLITDYADFDVVFVHHMAGTMKNSITGQTISQVGVLRGSKKTFFFDCGGYPLSDLSCRVVALHDAALALGFPAYFESPQAKPSQAKPQLVVAMAGGFDGI